MDDRIYICTLQRAEGDTGVQAHVRTLRQYFAAHGVESTLITPYSWETLFFFPLFALRGVLRRFSEEWGVWWYRSVRLWALRWRMLWRLRATSRSIVYCQCPVSAAAALQARSGSGHRVVMITHFNVSQADEWVGQGLIRDKGRLWHAIRKFEETVLPRLDAIIYVSSYMRDILTSRIPALSTIEHATIPNFLPLPDGSQQRRAPAGRPINLVCIGTLEPRKNQAYALDVVDRAVASGLQATLTIVGDGVDRQRLQRHAAKLGIRANVRFLGRVKNATALLGDFDALIHTARMESFGIVLIEAMAHGMPVFAVPVGGVPGVFADGVEGCYLPADNADAAAAALAHSLGDAACYERMSDAAYSRAQRDYGLESVGRRLLAFLRGGASAAP